MRKRIGALGLAAVLLLAMISPALAAETKFVVKGPDTAPRKGETFTVVVELEGNPGFNSIQFTLTYDKEQLRCTKAEVGSLVADMLAVTNSKAPKGAVVACASLDTVLGDGTVGVFTFVAESDLSELQFGLEEVLISDYDGKAIAYQVDDQYIKQNDKPSMSDATTEKPSTEPQPASAPDPAPQTNPLPAQEPQPEPDLSSQPEAEPVQEITFTDTKGHWAESYVSRAAELGLFKGYPDGSFQPNQDVTRAQYVTVLYRMAGSPAVAAEAPFSDIASQSQEFRTAIAWGYENGYLNGKGEGVFDPAGSVTRQEAMKILFGYDGGVSGMETMFTGIYDGHYTDSGDIAAWGKAGMYWGVYRSLISGTTDTTLSPNGTATRAQLAKILTVYYDQQNKQ